MPKVFNLLSYDIAEYIEKYIHEHGLQPGDRLPTERELAAQLDITRVSVRQGYKRLLDQGVIRSENGYYVNPPRTDRSLTLSSGTPPPHAPGLAMKPDTGTAEQVFEHIDGRHTRKAAKKAARKAQQEATARTKSSRLQFTDEERANPELETYIQKSDKAADRLDAAKAAIPKKKTLAAERTFDEATGRGKTRLHFEEKEKPIPGKPAKNPLSRPAQEAGIFVHNKIHSVEKDNSGVEIMEAGEVPMGILSGVEPVLMSRKLWEGDRIVMVSDGVLDALPGDDKEQAMQQYLESVEEMGPQELADQVLDFAVSFIPAPRDDMTVLTAGIWKRRS